MQKLKFKIASIPEIGRPQMEMDGYLFDNPKFPDHKFVVHRYSVAMDTHLEVSRMVETNLWVASEHSTGMQIGCPQSTRKAAIEHSVEHLNSWRGNVFAPTVEKYKKINNPIEPKT